MKFPKVDCVRDKKKVEIVQGVPWATNYGSLMYATVMLRLDIVHAIGTMHFLTEPGQNH